MLELIRINMEKLRIYKFSISIGKHSSTQTEGGMRLSVIIPFHRGEAYLKDCLDSLKEQTYRDMEILLVCDHVMKEELTLLADYESDLSIGVYHLEDRFGVAAARNLGLEKALGDYVYFLDSDDYLYGNTIDNLMQAAGLREDDIIYGKKKPTWFKRSIYLAMKQEQESGDIEEEEEDSAIESSELEVENEGDNGKDTDAEEDAGDEKDDQGDKEGIKEGEDEEGKAGQDGVRWDDEADSSDAIGSLELQEKERRKRTMQAYRILVSKRKGVRYISVLNILFKRSLLEDHKIRFHEKMIYFSDLPFLMETFSKTDRFCKRLSAVYIKRKHNDAINFPALSQIKDPDRFYEFLAVYYETVERLPGDSDLRSRVDKKYIKYYAINYAPLLKRSKNDIWRNENFLRMSEIARGMDRHLIRDLKGYKKKIIKALIHKNVKKSIRIVKVHLGYKKLRRILKNRKSFAKFLYVNSFLKKPMKNNWILFESFFGKSYSDSPKYIYEYLAKNSPGEYKFIWVINKKGTQIPYKHRKVKRFSIRYSYYMARCGYYIFNGRQPEWVRKREGNIFLQTWHGTPLKRLVFDMEDVSSATPRYKQQVYKQSRAWDYLIAPNAFSAKTFRRCFMFHNKILETGYPRNDLLHAPDREELAVSIRQKLGIPHDMKTILYAPTWRDDEFYEKGRYKFELALDPDYMKRNLGDEYVLLIRTHYFIADSLDISALGGFAVNVSRYDDITELYLISDILITDYSSVFFDYANLKRPMLFFTYDLEKYRDVLRGFYLDIEKEVPGPLLFTTEEIVDAVKDIDTIKLNYMERYMKFYHRFCGWEDGQASKKVVESVFSK